MIYLWLPIGLVLPTFSGWALLRLLEGTKPVLCKWERVLAGLPLGILLTMFLSFLVALTGIGNFSLMWMLGVQVITAVLLGALFLRDRSRLSSHATLEADHTKLSKWQKVLAIVLGAWIVAKLIAGTIFLVGPAYFDDTISNWNLRGKIFYVQQDLVLEVEPGKIAGVSSYPQAVSLVKTWLANLNSSWFTNRSLGEGWHEGLVNSIHMVWHLCLLGLVYYALRRLVSRNWSLIGTYILASLPLFTMHAAAAYADQMLSLHIFLAVTWLLFAVRNQGDSRVSYLKIGAVATALLIFTKNEALLLHLPPIALLLVLILAMKKFSVKEAKTALIWYIGLSVCVLLPWIFFKFSNDLGFANAKDVSGLSLKWHPGVLETIFNNTFFEGNWSLFPVLFIGLLVAKWRLAFRTSLVLLTGFFWMVWLGQLPIYMFTELSTEVLMQTGYARGIIHLIPVAVVVTTVLLANVLESNKT